MCKLLYSPFVDIAFLKKAGPKFDEIVIQQGDSEDDGSTDDSETVIIQTELITDPIISYLDL